MKYYTFVSQDHCLISNSNSSYNNKRNGRRNSTSTILTSCIRTFAIESEREFEVEWKQKNSNQNKLTHTYVSVFWARRICSHVKMFIERTHAVSHNKCTSLLYIFIVVSASLYLRKQNNKQNNTAFSLVVKHCHGYGLLRFSSRFFMQHGKNHMKCVYRSSIISSHISLEFKHSEGKITIGSKWHCISIQKCNFWMEMQLVQYVAGIQCNQYSRLPHTIRSVEPVSPYSMIR